MNHEREHAIKKSYSVTLALTLAALGLSMAHAGETEIAAKAQQTLRQEMGAKDMTVAVDGNGVATLQGWAQQPKDVSQARYLVSRVEGVKAAHSSGVRTWSSTDKY